MLKKDRKKRLHDLLVHILEREFKMNLRFDRRTYIVNWLKLNEMCPKKFKESGFPFSLKETLTVPAKKIMYHKYVWDRLAVWLANNTDFDYWEYRQSENPFITRNLFITKPKLLKNGLRKSKC